VFSDLARSEKREIRSVDASHWRAMRNDPIISNSPLKEAETQQRQQQRQRSKKIRESWNSKILVGNSRRRISPSAMRVPPAIGRLGLNTVNTEGFA